MPEADELIAGVRLRRKMAEAVVSWVVTDRLHPAKIIASAVPRAAQLCVLTLGTRHGTDPDGNSKFPAFFRSLGISVGSQTEGDRETEGTKEGQWGGMEMMLKWHHAQTRAHRPAKPKCYL